MRSVLISTSLSSFICSWLASRCSKRSPSQQRFPWALQLKEQILKEQITDGCVFFKMLFCPCPSGCGRLLSADDGHNLCLQCLGFQHAEDAFVDDSCTCCGRMSMTSHFILCAIWGQHVDRSIGNGLTSSEDEGAVGMPPSGVVATPTLDPELMAMLARKAMIIGLEVNRPPNLEPSRLDDWFLGAGRGSQPRSAPVPVFQCLISPQTTPSRALPSSSRRYSSRQRWSSTSCPGVMHWPPLSPGTVLSLSVAVGALLRPPELLRPRLNWHLGRCVEPLAGERRPPRPSQAPSRPGSRQSSPDAGNPEKLEFALSQQTARTAPLLPLEQGWEENPVFIFVSVTPLVQGPAVLTFSKKEQFPFPPASQVHGTPVCDALLPHSRPRPILPAAKRVRFGDAVPPHAPLASPVWDPGSSARMPPSAPPSVLSSPTPLRCTTTGT